MVSQFTYSCRGLLFLVALATLAQSCGSSAPTAVYTAGVYEPHAQLADFCNTPRVGIDPATGNSYPDRQGSTLIENLWMRSWTNDLYLWYNEVPDLNPGTRSTAEYFNLMKTTQLTTTGRPKDRFHFTYPSLEWYALSQGGVSVSYGISFAFIANSPPRKLLVAFVEPNAPSQTLAAALPRGASVVAIDGVDFVNATGQANINVLNAGLFPSSVGESHVFTVKDTPTSPPRNVTLVAAIVASVPVQNMSTFAVSGGVIGYLLFNDHYAVAESLLFDAFNAFVNAGVTDLVLDLRYNGGGFLDIASEISFMIAGPTATAGKVFERQQFNDKHPLINPVTGQTIVPIPFHATSRGFTNALAAGQALPSLSLPRVFLLTTDDTCSASESIINGLRGIGVNVVQIGSTTCGKPYAFYPQDNCGTTYFSIQLRGVNHLGFGDYSDGFSPANSPVLTNAVVPGCAVADDFTHALGDPNEALFAAALRYRTNGTCPTPTAKMAPRFMPESSGIRTKLNPMNSKILRR